MNMKIPRSVTEPPLWLLLAVNICLTGELWQ